MQSFECHFGVDIALQVDQIASGLLGEHGEQTMAKILKQTPDRSEAPNDILLTFVLNMPATWCEDSIQCA